MFWSRLQMCYDLTQHSKEGPRTRTGNADSHGDADPRTGALNQSSQILFRLGRSYKVRFNSVSSYSDSRKSSGDGPDLRDNFESTGPLANVR